MKSLISFTDAIEIVFKQGQQRREDDLNAHETVPLAEANGRLGAETIYGQEAVPSFNNSSMDGFAVRAEETVKASLENQLTFKVLGRVLAGDAPKPATNSLSEKSCYEIMTGAPVPEGYDAIYKIEDVAVAYDKNKNPQAIKINTPIEKFMHFRKTGADFAPGQKLFDPLTLLMPEHMMALASVGVGQVKVLKKPKVAVLCTGSELVLPEEKTLIPGKIRNSSSAYLLSAMNFFGANAQFYGIVNDNREIFTSSLKKIIAEKPEVIITTGAVSKGAHDFIPEVIENLGANIFFHNVKMRPGKPQLFAQFAGAEGPAFFGLPGNPISTVVGLRFFVNAYLRGLTGQTLEPVMQAKLKNDVEKPEGLRCFFKAHLEMTLEGAKITSLSGQQSFMISSLMQANAWVVLPEKTDYLRAGEIVEFYPIYPLSYNYAVSDQAGQVGQESCC